MRFENRCAIVTGAAQGLGFAIAKRLNDEGCKVAMLDINEEKVSASAAQLSGCFGMKCDVSSAEDISRAVKAAAEKLGGVDIRSTTPVSSITPRSQILPKRNGTPLWRST